MPQTTKTVLLFIMTIVAYVTIGKAPGIAPVRNRDIEASIARSIAAEGRDT